MKKIDSLPFVILFSVCTILFFGCKNFMDSDGQLEQLNEAIKYANAPYVNIEIKTDPRATLSMIPAVGEYNNKYKATDSISLNFTENDDYYFLGWKSIPENAVSFENSKERITKATILSADKPIIIEPNTVLLDTLSVNFLWDQGSVSVPNANSFKLNEEFSFRYNAITDYAFLYWEVKDSQGNVRNDILQLSGNGIDITAKVLKVNESITIKAVTSKRPKVVSYSPLFSSDGVYRDRRIVVMFDQDIDESSIYFDENEQKELRAEGCTLVFDTVEGRKDKCYAYKDKAGNLFWKNITIVLRKVGTSYLEYYNAPFFDANDKSILYIDPKIDNPPPGGKEVLVVVNQKILSAKEKIELAGECRWAYFTNGGIDKEGPKFSDGFTVTFDDNNVKSKIENMNELQQNKVSKNKITMTVKGSYVDDGAGAGGLKYQVVQVDSPYYSTSKKALPNGAISVEIAKANATVIEEDDANKIEIDLRDEYFDEGIYRIDIIASDCNGKDTFFDNQYYFVKDNTPPEEPLVYSGSLTNGVRLFIDMSKERSKDIKNVEITGHDEATIDINNNNIVDKIFTKGLSNGQGWDYTVIVSDYAGNTVQKSISTYAGLKYGYYCYLTENNNVYFSPSNDNEVGVLQGVVIDNCPYINGNNNEFITGETVKILSKDFYIPESGEKLPITTIQDGRNPYLYARRSNGLDIYKNILNHEELIVKNNFPLFHDIWKNKNKEDTSAIIWYIPSIAELKDIVGIDSSVMNYNLDKLSGKEGIRIINFLDKNDLNLCSSSFVISGSSLDIEYRYYSKWGGVTNENKRTLSGGDTNQKLEDFVYLLMAQVDPTK